MSRWAIWLSCRYLTADAIYFILTAVYCSGSTLFFFKSENRVPYYIYYRTMYMWLLSSNWVYRVRMFSWFRYACNLSSRMNWSIIRWLVIICLGTFFIANNHPVGLWTARYTTPNFPSPKFFLSIKLFIYTYWIGSSFLFMSSWRVLFV